jgi:hypothetical protein
MSAKTTVVRSLARLLHEQGQNYYIIRTMYYVIKNQLRPQEQAVLHGSENLEPGADESPDLLAEVHSAWTPRIVDVSENADVELSKLANQFLHVN